VIAKEVLSEKTKIKYEFGYLMASEIAVHLAMDMADDTGGGSNDLVGVICQLQAERDFALTMLSDAVPGFTPDLVFLELLDKLADDYIERSAAKRHEQAKAFLTWIMSRGKTH
jgi:hypothetical protein